MRTRTPTTNQRSTTPDSVSRAVIERIDFEDNKRRHLRNTFHLTGLAWRGARRLVMTLSRGRIDPEQSDVVMVFRRTAKPLGLLAEAVERQSR